MSQEMESELRKVEAISEFVDLLVRAVHQGEDDGRQHRDKIRQRVIYGLKIEDADLLKALGAPDVWMFDVELGNGWARRKWPDANFDPARVVPPPLVASIALGDETSNTVIPGDLAQCQQELEVSLAAMRRLRDVIRTQEEDLRRLRPLAERFEYICATNQHSAKKPRNA